MELPKNIVQIGKPDKLHKIFVEDYVISYIKQLNRKIGGTKAGLAFYGKRSTENNIRYYFLYGAAQISGLEGRGQYLSELERESIEQYQRNYFEEYDFLAWCSIGGELPDGFYLLEQGKGLLINGYACFYEKNENMLNFMLTTGNEEREREKETVQVTEASSRVTQAGTIDSRIRRQESTERQVETEAAERISNRERAKTSYFPQKETKVSGLKTVVVGIAIVLCILGITTLNDPKKLEELQVVARQVMENLSEKKIPDKEEADLLPSGEAKSKTDAEQMAEKVAEENANVLMPEEKPSEVIDMPVVIETPAEVENPETVVNNNIEETNTKVQTTTYVIAKGDTLLDICRNKYGSISRVQEICNLNGIDNADDIKIGQIILLPE